ncbi:MAG TPA: hypothetical protein VND95_04925 [Stellaceae bacterium]|nr:hypothetical protein [Stellaceae bacterium]
MSRTTIAVASIVALCAAGSTLAGCGGPHAFVKDGDQKSVDVAYSGDVATALPLARQHCAAFNRVPHLVDRSPYVAYFDCLPR